MTSAAHGSRRRLFCDSSFYRSIRSFSLNSNSRNSQQPSLSYPHFHSWHGHPLSSRSTCRHWNKFDRTFSLASSNNHSVESSVKTTLDDFPTSLLKVSPAIQRRIRTMKARHDHILQILREGGDPASIGKELSSLAGVAGLYDQVQRVQIDRLSLMDLWNETQNNENDEVKESLDLQKEIQEELTRLDEQLESLSLNIMHALVPIINPEDRQDLTLADAVIDIRAGTGGDEAALFAAEIMAGYEALAKRGGGLYDSHGGVDRAKAWDVEILSVSRTDLGGVKEASLAVSSRGNDGAAGGAGFDLLHSFKVEDSKTMVEQLIQQLGPYGYFQYESGVHRVQRVPVNDKKLQTSAVSVAVLPSIPDNQIMLTLPSSELKIETMRASGAGGQHVNTTESAVRVTHVPTGIMAYMQEERSQHKNKAKALKLVATRVYSLKKEQALKHRSAARNSLMGGGDRSERIRTYNFPQDRITDHRCKVSVTGMQSWLGTGNMVGKFLPHLYEMEREERIEALEEEEDAFEKSSDGESGKGKVGKGKSRR